MWEIESGKVTAKTNNENNTEPKELALLTYLYKHAHYFLFRTHVNELDICTVILLHYFVLML